MTSSNGVGRELRLLNGFTVNVVWLGCSQRKILSVSKEMRLITVIRS